MAVHLRDRLAAGGVPLVVAHRGAWGDLPENSCAAIRAARRFDMVELDVRLAAGGEPVLLHDPDLSRTTGQAGACRDLGLAQITAWPLLAGAGGAGAVATDERVPTLAQALDAAGPDLLIDLDVKDPAEIEAVAAAMSGRADRGRAMLKLDVQAPGDIDRLCALERRHGVTVIAKLRLHRAADLAAVEALAAAGVAAAEVWFADLPLLRQAATRGLPLTTFTLRDVHCAGLSDDLAATDPGAAWEPLVEAGIWAIMTDRAADLRQWLADRG